MAVHASATRESKTRPPKQSRSTALNGLQILGSRFAGLAIDHDLERDTLAFTQLAQSGALDSADVDEHILAAALGLDKSITLLRVEPFHCSVAHGTLLCRISI